jgi:hypothetical protein
MGLIIGLLGKFVAPGDRDNIPHWLTVRCGIAGVLIGYYVAAALGVDRPVASIGFGGSSASSSRRDPGRDRGDGYRSPQRVERVPDHLGIQPGGSGQTCRVRAPMARASAGSEEAAESPPSLLPSATISLFFGVRMSFSTPAPAGDDTSTVLDDAPRRRLSTETKASVKTTELFAYLGAVVGVLLASQLIGTEDGHDDYFRADRAWFFVVLLTIGYLLSRGIAKSDSRDFYDAR